MTLLRGLLPHDGQSSILNFIRAFGMFDLERGPWVAGGAVRRLLTERPEDWAYTSAVLELEVADLLSSLPAEQSTTVTGIPDIDIFVANADQHDRVQAALSRHDDLRQKQRRGQSHTDYYLRHVKVQLVKRLFFSSVEQLLADFDFTVCMAATDGHAWVADERFFADCASKTLRLNNFEQRRHFGVRLAKYCSYGFTPEPGVLGNTLGIHKPGFKERLDGHGCIPFIEASEEY